MSMWDPKPGDEALIVEYVLGYPVRLRRTKVDRTTKTLIVFNSGQKFRRFDLSTDGTIRGYPRGYLTSSTVVYPRGHRDGLWAETAVRHRAIVDGIRAAVKATQDARFTDTSSRRDSAAVLMTLDGVIAELQAQREWLAESYEQLDALDPILEAKEGS